MPAALIRDYVTPTPQTIGRSIELKKAIEMMRDHGIRHIPVLCDGKLVGVLSDREARLALSVHPSATNLTVEQVMVDEPYTVTEDTRMVDVLTRMVADRHGCVLVTEKTGRLIGVFTAQDAVRVLSETVKERGVVSAVPIILGPGTPCDTV